jgi:hypothetical protein
MTRLNEQKKLIENVLKSTSFGAVWQWILWRNGFPFEYIHLYYLMNEKYYTCLHNWLCVKFTVPLHQTFWSWWYQRLSCGGSSLRNKCYFGTSTLPLPHKPVKKWPFDVGVKGKDQTASCRRRTEEATRTVHLNGCFILLLMGTLDQVLEGKFSW